MHGLGLNVKASSPHWDSLNTNHKNVDNVVDFELMAPLVALSSSLSQSLSWMRLASN
jgi:hypothetical protein